MTESLKTVVARMASDPAFAARVKEDPDAVAAEYGLDPGALAPLVGARVDTRSRTHQRLEERLSRSALVFGGDMGGGDSGGDSGSDSGGDDSSSSSSSSDDSDSSDSSDSDSSGSGRESDSSSDSDDRSSRSESESRSSEQAESRSGTGSDDDSTSSEQTTREPDRSAQQPAQPQGQAPPATEPGPAAAAPTPTEPAVPAGTENGAPPAVAGPVASPSDAAADDDWFSLLAGDDRDGTDDGRPADETPSRAEGDTGGRTFEDALFGRDADTDQDAGDDADQDLEQDRAFLADDDARGDGLDDVQDIADTGVAGPVMAPGTIPNSPLGYPQSGNEPNGTYHGGAVREQVITADDGTRQTVITYDDGTTGIQTERLNDEGDTVLDTRLSDGTEISQIFTPPTRVEFVTEPDNTVTARHIDFSSGTMNETVMPNDGTSQEVSWSGEFTEPVPGSGLFTIDTNDENGDFAGLISVTATEDGGAVAFSMDADGRSVTARLDVSEVENADGTTSRVYLFPDGRTETFTFNDAGIPIAHEGHDPLPGMGDRPPLQFPVPGANVYHGGEIGSVETGTNPDGSTTHLVTYADGNAVEVTREFTPDGIVDRWVSPEGTQVFHVVGDGRGAELLTDPFGNTTTRNWDFDTLQEHEIRTDGTVVDTDWKAVDGVAGPGDALFTTQTAGFDGIASEVTSVTATADGGARAVVVTEDGSSETVRLDVQEIDNIDGTQTRIYTFPSGRTEAFTFDRAGAPISHEAWPEPGPIMPMPVFLENATMPADGGGMPTLAPGHHPGGLTPGGFDIDGTGGETAGAEGMEGDGPQPDGSIIETSVDEDGSTTTTTTFPDGTRTDAVFAPDGTSTTTTVDPTGLTRITETNLDGSLSRTLVQPDGTATSETQMPDGTTASESVAPDGTTTGREVFPDGTVRTEVFDPASGITTDRITTPDGTTNVMMREADGGFTTMSRSPDGTSSSSSFEADGDGRGSVIFPNGDTEFFEIDGETGEKTVTRNAVSGFTSTDHFLPDGTIISSSGFPGGDTTVDTFDAAGVLISHEVVGPDGRPVPGSEPVVPPVAPELDGLLGQLVGGLSIGQAGSEETALELAPETDPGTGEAGRWIPGFAGPVWLPAGAEFGGPDGAEPGVEYDPTVPDVEPGDERSWDTGREYEYSAAWGPVTSQDAQAGYAAADADSGDSGSSESTEDVPGTLGEYVDPPLTPMPDTEPETEVDPDDAGWFPPPAAPTGIGAMASAFAQAATEVVGQA
ncbi:hypothetical protein [Actinomycetospora aeridis]|uniref:Uncharacterized protein n=1 Tax=Actinomycetospora aeridis TaxID=3129231 RepID=A0ABU8ND91_9PSEU